MNDASTSSAPLRDVALFRDRISAAKLHHFYVSSSPQPRTFSHPSLYRKHLIYQHALNMVSRPQLIVSFVFVADASRGGRAELQ